MNILPTTPPGHKISFYCSQQEVELLLDLRRCPDKQPELVTHAERTLLAFVRHGKADLAANTARELATMAADYAAYQALCDADEALGFRDAS